MRLNLNVSRAGFSLLALLLPCAAAPSLHAQSLVLDESWIASAWVDVTNHWSFNHAIVPGSLELTNAAPVTTFSTNVLGQASFTNNAQLITATTNRVTESSVLFALQTAGNRALINQIPPLTYRFDFGTVSAGMDADIWVAAALSRTNGKATLSFFRDGASELLEVGVFAGDVLGTVAKTNGVPVSSNGISTARGPHWLVVQIDGTGSNPVTRAWLDPQVGITALGSAPALSVTNPYLTGFDFDFLSLRGTAFGTSQFDEIRVGRSFSSVGLGRVVNSNFVNASIEVAFSTNQLGGGTTGSATGSGTGLGTTSGTDSGAGTTGSETGGTGTGTGATGSGTTGGAATAGGTGSGSSTGGSTGAGTNAGPERLSWMVAVTRPADGATVRFKAGRRGLGTVRGTITETGLPKKEAGVIVQLAVQEIGATPPTNEPSWADVDKVSKVNKKGATKFKSKRVGAQESFESGDRVALLVRATAPAASFAERSTDTARVEVVVK